MVTIFKPSTYILLESVYFAIHGGWSIDAVSGGDFEASGQRRPAPMSQNVLSRAQGKRSRVDDLGTRCQEALSNLRKP